MDPEVVQLSFRLGGADGVAVEARKWEWALEKLGFHVRRVAGEFDDVMRRDDTLLPFLAIDPADDATPDHDGLHAAIEGADLVVVENLCSLPLNPDASKAAADVLTSHEGRVVFRHHDLAWQRPGLYTPDGIPPQRADSLHVTINDHSRVQLENRGFAAVTIRNAFDLDPTPGERDRTRGVFGFEPGDVVLLQPTRAIPRKNVPGAVSFANELARLAPRRRFRFWVTGPAEDGYEDEFRRALADATMPVTVGRAASASDAYAAADLVLFPSTWEGFGNPVIESIAHRRPIVVGTYPVLEEIRAFGVELLSVHDPERAWKWLENPRGDVIEQNVERVRPHLSLTDLPARLDAQFAADGWTVW
jgi:glycosyltransferase involved in cell wall biosynthesis